MARRKYGTGSVFYDASRARWVATVDVPATDGEGRRRRKFYRATREEADAALVEWHTENPRPDGPTLDGRALNMEHARSLGTHTAVEWFAKVRTYGGLCHYCGRSCVRARQKDHRVPVSRGGSDAIDNLVPACMDCNLAKGSLTDEEFIAWAEEAGFYEWPRKHDRHHGRATLREKADKR